MTKLDEFNHLSIKLERKNKRIDFIDSSMSYKRYIQLTSVLKGLGWILGVFAINSFQVFLLLASGIFSNKSTLVSTIKVKEDNNDALESSFNSASPNFQSLAVEGLSDHIYYDGFFIFMSVGFVGAIVLDYFASNLCLRSKILQLLFFGFSFLIFTVCIVLLMNLMNYSTDQLEKPLFEKTTLLVLLISISFSFCFRTIFFIRQ